MPGPGNVLGHFRLIEKIGEGGMGIVYRARDERLDRDVAVKVLNEKMLAESSSRQRFHQEALTLGRLNHPNVETIYDFHSENGLDYLVIEYVAGNSLDELLEKGPLTENEVGELGEQLAKGLAAAHMHGVIHGDLKPSNLRVTPDKVLKVLDFGLARLLASPDAKTVTNHDSGSASGYGGTLPYMSPEQIDGGEPDERSDIYSAGVVLYEMATGALPFSQRGNLRGAILYAAPAPVRERHPKISLALDTVILKCLEKDRSRRFQSAQELAVELNRATAGFSWATTFWRAVFAINRHPWAAAAVLAVLLAAGGLIVRRFVIERTPPPRMSVVVAEFDNRTGERVFDQTPSELISAALGESPQVYVYPASRIKDVLKRMKAPEKTEINEKIAGEICTREGLQSVVSGSVSKLGSKYVVMAQVLSCNGDQILSTQKQFTRPEQLPPAIDEIAATIRRRLGESDTAIQHASQPLATVTSSSLEAIQLYSRGKEELYQGNFTGAITLFKKAVELDDEFAMAHEYLATAYLHMSDSGRAEAEYAKAAQLSNRVTEKEREKILGDYALFEFDTEKAIPHYQVLTVLSPDDPAPHVNLAECYRYEARFVQAIAEAQKAIDLTGSPSVKYNLALYTYLSGDTNKAMDLAREVLKEMPESPKALHLLGNAYLATTEEKEARAVWNQMLQLGSTGASLARLTMADAAWTRDRPAEAALHLEHGAVVDEEAGNVYESTRKQTLAGEAYLAAGDRAGVTRVVAKLEQPSDPELIILLGRLYAHSGRIAAARQQLRRLEESSNPTPRVLSHRNLLRAEIAIAQNQGAEAVQYAALAMEQYNSPLPLGTLARAYEKAGNLEGAARQYELLLARRNERQLENADWDALHAVTTARVSLGRLYQSMGKTEKAKVQFEELLKYGGEGQPVGPMYQDVKARLAKINRNTAGAGNLLPQRTELIR